MPNLPSFLPDRRQLTRRLPGVAVAALVALILTASVLASAPATGRLHPGTSASDIPSTPEPESSTDPAGDRQDRLEELVGDYLAAHPGFTATVAIGDDLGRHEIAGPALESASVAKLEILVRWLLARQSGPLPQDEYALARRMMSESDNEATDTLCIDIIGDTAPEDVPGGTGLCTSDGWWGAHETTAADQLDVLAAAWDPGLLSEESREVVRDLMSQVVPWQVWGISAAARDGEAVWLKNGWDERDGWLVHSVGVVGGPTPVRIAVLTGGHTDYETGVAHVERIAALARQALDGH
ncbi:hypothetical protein LX16_5165 [Stackebrandtia albiflava]|uniref:Beta-lactamase class A catalytic domain-containing protein n=1 Tax=Stackebrandtia albiflava TaxID=406432 RepID=A0A562ULE5_9ACTN|nr:serine hydrolase [Stackebrandtia albiflava]TWJ06429.1 hypothetical protein LX16_5165 [Stackebrandtia albiflava]